MDGVRLGWMKGWSITDEELDGWMDRWEKTGDERSREGTRGVGDMRRLTDRRRRDL